MINKLKYAIIANIANFNLVYYDPKDEEKLIAFCKKNGFSHLPRKDKKSVYKLVDNHFVEKRLEDVYTVNASDFIFDLSTINKFEEPNPNEIHFIVERNLIKGMVHIVDYNNIYINVELFKAILKFESNLRQLLIDHDLDNDDFIGWVNEKAAVEDNPYWHRIKNGLLNNRKHLKYANLFQTFSFRDLLNFAQDKNILPLSDREINDVSNVRNSLAHNRDVTSQMDDDKGSIVYDFVGLKLFAEKMRSFFNSYDILEEKVRK
ncbi:MAG: hypothetical protein PHI32_02665 [Dysgonamonadaceae bacterium]|nr:hypothetical protein [Dysgonamonadaceae bacterium]